MSFTWTRSRSCRICGPLAVLMIAVLAGPAHADVVKNDHVSLRQGPGAYYPVVQVLERGSSVSTHDKKAGWTNVTTVDGVVGWAPTRAFTESSTTIDYSSMAQGWTDRSTSRTVVSAATKGFYEKKLKEKRLNRDILQQPFWQYFSPAQYLDFKRETYGTESPVRGVQPNVRADTKNSCLVPEAIFPLSAYVAARLTAPGLSPDKQKVQYVNKVAQLVAENTEIYDRPVSVHVVCSSEVFCNALPTGVIVISDGFLNLIRSEDELACVLGHELAHVTLQHGLTELEKRKTCIKAESAFDELDELTGTQDPDMDELAYDMFEQAIRGRKEEYESQADVRGFLYACRAGYNGEAMIGLLKRLEASIPGDARLGSPTHWVPGSLRRRVKALENTAAVSSCSGPKILARGRYPRIVPNGAEQSE